MTAIKRLMRDLVEWERSGVDSISAVPMTNNIFEWHVNIKPNDGVYSGVYFHLIMKFDKSYPLTPPKVTICTPIKHPNIMGSFICLSMLRSYTNTVAYEGWSSAYSITSILMQLQSFLFAEKIDQDGGYTAEANLTDKDVAQSLRICKRFVCKNTNCKHSHAKPYPKVNIQQTLISVESLSEYVTVQGSACQTTRTSWVGAYGNYAVNDSKVMYEVYINWTGDKWRDDNIRGGLCRFGYGTENAVVCGRDHYSFGYGGTGMYSYNNKFTSFGTPFAKGDTITCAVDFHSQRIYFALNGKIVDENTKLYLPHLLVGKYLFPFLSFKNSRAEFNFGKLKKPCAFLLQNGFQTFEQYINQYSDEGNGDKNENIPGNGGMESSMIHFIIDECLISIFCYLSVPEIHRCRDVCTKWFEIIDNYNIMERNSIYCYYSKLTANENVLGIGLNVSLGVNGQLKIESQMDILSLNAWKLSRVRTGVWGEELTHFLPLVINNIHAQLACNEINQRLQILSQLQFKNAFGRRMNSIQMRIAKDPILQQFDTLVSMMNSIVVQFAMDNKRNSRQQLYVHGDDGHNYRTIAVSMRYCEKAVLGYCTFYHLLLYLQNRYKQKISSICNSMVRTFVNTRNMCEGRLKKITPDLGKLLIYTMMSEYNWDTISESFMYEVFVRNVKWYIRNYPSLNCTRNIDSRLQETFDATAISRSLVMFQVWFMQNVLPSLKDYNRRLGRPPMQMRQQLQTQSEKIFGCQSWKQYFQALKVEFSTEGNSNGGDKQLFNRLMNQLLCWSVYESYRVNYHGYGSYGNDIQQMDAPRIRYFGYISHLNLNLNAANDDSAIGGDNNRNSNQWRGKSIKIAKMQKSWRNTNSKGKKNVNMDVDAVGSGTLDTNRNTSMDVDTNVKGTNVKLSKAQRRNLRRKRQKEKKLNK